MTSGVNNKNKCTFLLLVIFRKYSGCCNCRAIFVERSKYLIGVNGFRWQGWVDVVRTKNVHFSESVIDEPWKRMFHIKKYVRWIHTLTPKLNYFWSTFECKYSYSGMGRAQVLLNVSQVLHCFINVWSCIYFYPNGWITPLRHFSSNESFIEMYPNLYLPQYT